jgi:hypothetical protein
MTSYRVCFFNEIPRNDRLFKCCQRSIVICAARTPERAIEAAKKRFSPTGGHPRLEDPHCVGRDRTDRPRTNTAKADRHCIREA